MNIIQAGAEQLGARPDFLFQARDISNAARWGGGLVLAGAGAIFSALKAVRTVPEGSVGIRTFNGRAVDRHGEPLHKLLSPGRKFMMPFFHDVELVTLQTQTTPIAAKVDIPMPRSPRKFTQYDLEAVASWGVIADREEDSRRPVVRFQDAYRFFYGIDEMEDLEMKVAGATTAYLSECVEDLPPKNRTRRELAAYANEAENLEYLDLSEFGVRVFEIDLASFAHGGVIQFGASAQGVSVRVTQ